MKKKGTHYFRDLALVLLTFMPALFAFGMLLFVLFGGDSRFAFFAARPIAPLICAGAVVFFSQDYKVSFRFLQVLLMWLIAWPVSILLPVDPFLDPMIMGSMKSAFVYVGVEIALLILGKWVTDLLLMRIPGAINPDRPDEEAEPYQT